MVHCAVLFPRGEVVEEERVKATPGVHLGFLVRLAISILSHIERGRRKRSLQNYPVVTDERTANELGCPVDILSLECYPSLSRSRTVCSISIASHGLYVVVSTCVLPN